MIVVTGAFGFIGSCLVQRLNEEGYNKNIIVVDDFYKDKKEPNLEGKWMREWIHRDIFIPWFKKSGSVVDVVYHLGARTDTISTDKDVFNKLNLNFSKDIWSICAEKSIPLIYASSAATYGNGSEGFKDSQDILPALKPLNEYAISKNEFDKWAFKQEKKPPKWMGMKFFNVYGPNEYHKGKMASVIFHAYNQIKAIGEMKLFKSHHADYKDGYQLRDFIYVKDVVDICLYLWQNEIENGLYNVGTGQARTFLDLTKNTFTAMEAKEEISFIDTPASIRDNYQYFTEADISKLRSSGYDKAFTTLEEGVKDYVTNYLVEHKYY